MDCQELLRIRNFGPIKDVELVIRPYMFFVGASGSGKSTILKVLAMMRHIFKLMNLRSYLKLGGVADTSINISSSQYLSNGGLIDFMNPDTRITYVNFGYEISLSTPTGLTGTKKVIDADKLSLEKISFISDQRGAIASLLAHNNDGEALGFYFSETFNDFKEAAESVKAIDIPFLNTKFYVQKGSNGIRQFHIGDLDAHYAIHFENASSGIHTSAPLVEIAEYYSKSYDIVSSTNRSILKLLSQNDSLASFKPDMNIGDISRRSVHLHVEEPELSMSPGAQRSTLNMLIRKCRNAKTPMTLAVATHSPYIINQLNLLVKAYDSGKDVEGASLNYSDLGVYRVLDGKALDIKVENAHLVNPDYLSDDINDIYDEYEKMS